MKITETPYKLVDLWPQIMPGCYEALDICAIAKKDGAIWWPDYCQLPINAAFTYLRNKGKTVRDCAMSAAELTACWMWRKHKVVYAFDNELAATLAEQGKSIDDLDILPAQLLLHLPYPIVYIKAPALNELMDGFFFWIDYDIETKMTELRVQWVYNDMSSSVLDVLHLLPDKTLRECINSTNITVWRNTANYGNEIGVKTPSFTNAESVMCALQLILYVCAENAEIVPDTGNIPLSVQKKHKKAKSPTLQVIDGIESYFVGLHIGKALRKAKANYESTNGDGTKRRPHARRGHWHHYWTGPMTGDRKLVLKWTAPTFIHANEMNSIGGDVIVLPMNPKEKDD